MRFSIRKLLIAFIPVSIICAILGVIYQNHRAARDLDRLLEGAIDIELARVEIEAQQRKVICTDKESLRCIAGALRNSLGHPDGGGCFYRTNFTFSTGRTYSVVGQVGDRHLFLSVPSANPVEPEWPTHDIHLKEPLPPQLANMFEFLLLRWEEVGGLTMFIEEPKRIRYEYDNSRSYFDKGSRVNEFLQKNPPK